MKGFFECLIFATLAALAQGGWTIEETCAIVKNNTYIGTPDSCESFALCIDGKVAGTGSCNATYHYDVRNARCDLAEKVKCKIPSDSDFCKGLDDVYLEHPEDCNRYVYCNNSIAQYNKCPQNQNYDATSNSCKYNSVFPCTKGSACELVADNVFVKDNSSCNGFFRCSEGATIPGKCIEDYLYDTPRGMCNYPSQVTDCKNPIPPVTKPPTPKPGICAKKLAYVSDSTTCRGFFFCAAEDSVGEWAQCQGKTHFSEDKQSCVDPDAVKCPYNRCDGFDKGWTAKLGSNCQEFDICVNGTKPYSSMKCTNPDFSFFDEVAQQCVPKQPTYNICT